MFNTDFEMFYNLTLEKDTTKTTCTLNPTCGEAAACKPEECQPSPTYHTSAEYAQVHLRVDAKSTPSYSSEL